MRFRVSRARSCLGEAFADGDREALRRRLSWDGVAVSGGGGAGGAGSGADPAMRAGWWRRRSRRAGATARPADAARIPFAVLWQPWLDAVVDGELLAGLDAPASPAGPRRARAGAPQRLAQAGELAAYAMFEKAARRPPEAAHDAFCAQILAGGGWMLYAAHPVLLRQAVGLVLDWRASAGAVRAPGRRLPALAHTFAGGRMLGEVVAIGPGERPSPRRPQGPKLEFAVGAVVVYKPRDLATEALSPS
jgi:hypothetical protein